MDETAAREFVTEKLGVNIVPDKSKLLNNVVRAFFEKIPFQNVSTGILPPEQRFPSQDVVVENGTTLKGGLNVHNNGFAKILLEALGYNVHLVAARILQPPSSTRRPMGSHFAVVVRDSSEPGDLRLVDVGCGYPIFEPVPLKQLPYETTDVTLTYRFIEENGQWHSEHKDAEGDTWTRFASYNQVPVTGKAMESFKGPVLQLLREDWLVAGIIAVRYPQPGSTSIPNVPDFDKSLDYLIRYENDKITFRNSSGFTWEENVRESEVVSTLKNFFPTIPSDDVSAKIHLMENEAAQHSPERPWYICNLI